jgi:glycosyltransferase involved in cell wall biosynthesis
MHATAFPHGLSMALAHEWLDVRAGSEKTFELMCRAFPEADLYALTVNPSTDWDFGGRAITTTLLDRPFFRAHRSLSLPLMPLAWRRITGRRYDVVVTSSHACAKGFNPGRRALHLSYVYSPMRYAWYPELDQRSGFVPPFATRAFRAWDRRSADWVDEFASISTAVAERIRDTYGRESTVIFPPVDVEFFHPAPVAEERTHLLACSRMIPYKRLDLAVEVAAELCLPLVVAGRGPDEARLRNLAERIAPGLVSFEIGPDDRRLRELYRTASALIFAAHEDFGIVPVEAQACGTPVVALDQGGTRDTVVPGGTGALVAEQTAAAFAAGVEAVLAAGISPAGCVANAARFSERTFTESLLAWVAGAVEGRALRPAVAA